MKRKIRMLFILPIRKENASMMIIVVDFKILIIGSLNPTNLFNKTYNISKKYHPEKEYNNEYKIILTDEDK